MRQDRRQLASIAASVLSVLLTVHAGMPETQAEEAAPRGQVARPAQNAPPARAATRGEVEDARGVPVVAATGTRQLVQTPPLPQHPTAAKAYIVLETYCARCHQTGRPAQDGPPAGLVAPGNSSGLANILELDEIARVPALVRPGNPDASAIYQRMFEHPHATTWSGGKSAAEPSPLEIEAVRDWIEDLAQRSDAKVEACRSRPVIGHGEIAAAMQGWLGQIGPDAARDTRFLTLAHLANDCASDGELSAWRQAVTLVVNSLTWMESPVRLEAVGDTLTLFAVRLSALGWLPAHWEKLVAAYPRGAFDPLPEAVTRAAGTQVPVLRADWMASAAMRPPLYYDLLGLPQSLVDLGRLSGVEITTRQVAAAAPDRTAQDRARAGRSDTLRLAIRSSAVTGGARILERLHSPARPFWLAYDLAPHSDGRDPLDQANGVWPGLATGETPSRPGGNGILGVHAARAMFALPNGLPAFAVFGEDGRRQTAAGAERPQGGNAIHGAAAGAGCLGCHHSGLVAATDDMRAYLEGDKLGVDDAAKAAARMIHPDAGELQAVMGEDARAFRTAMTRVGVAPDVTVHGLVPLQALARQYELDVGTDRAAAEFGLERNAFVERLKSFDGPELSQNLVHRLRQGTLPRRSAEDLYLALRQPQRASATADAAAETSAAPLSGGDAEKGEGAAVGRPSLALWSDSPVYSAGELVAVYAQPSVDCHLTVINVDVAGRATVLFPNDFDLDNLVRAGSIRRIPARDGAYQLRLKDKGVESIVATCQTRDKSPEGIVHDFERQRFTILGNWRSFLRAASEVSKQTKREPDRGSARPRGRQVVRGRHVEARSDSRSDVRPEADTRPDASARAAIQIEVK